MLFHLRSCNEWTSCDIAASEITLPLPLGLNGSAPVVALLRATNAAGYSTTAVSDKVDVVRNAPNFTLLVVGGHEASEDAPPCYLRSESSIQVAWGIATAEAAAAPIEYTLSVSPLDAAGQSSGVSLLNMTTTQSELLVWRVVAGRMRFTVTAVDQASHRVSTSIDCVIDDAPIPPGEVMITNGVAVGDGKKVFAIDVREPTALHACWTFSGGGNDPLSRQGAVRFLLSYRWKSNHLPTHIRHSPPHILVFRPERGRWLQLLGHRRVRHPYAARST